MSKQANPTLIGGFVVGAVALVIAGVIFFGSGKFLSDKTGYVLYFDGNVAGLSVGAPVTFRGVRIGSVSRVMIHFDSEQMLMRVPVLIEIDNDKITSIDGKTPVKDRQKIIFNLVNRGLRAQLKVQSLVTGQLYVEFDFHPDKPARLVGVEVLGLDIHLAELPTIPSDFEELRKNLEKIPIETMISQAISALEGIEHVINSPETREGLQSFGNTMKNIEQLAAQISGEFPALNADIKSTVQDADKLVKGLDKKVGPLADDLLKTSRSARAAMEQARTSLDELQKVTREDSVMGYKLHNALEELAGAARSVRVMAEYLERHPEALLKGKGEN